MNTTYPPTSNTAAQYSQRQPQPQSQRHGAQRWEWLVARRNAGATPDVICKELVAAGWDADSAARTSLGSLRNSDRHRMLYNALTWGAGLAGLGAASAAHLALTESRNPLDLAFFITLMLVAGPIAISAGIVARKVESQEPHSIWSPTRRVLFGTLAGVTGAVGIIRLLTYTFRAVAAAVGAVGYEFTPTSVVQVMITLAVSVPLFAWSLAEWRRSNVAVRSLTTSSLQTVQVETLPVASKA